MSVQALSAVMELVNERVKFSARVEGKPPIIVDYIPPVGNGEGYTSLELLLVGMGTCLGTGIKTLAGSRLNKRVEALSVRAEGIRRETHPTSFQEVRLTLQVDAPDLSEAELEGLIAMAESKICPVLDMVKGNTSILINYALNARRESA